MYESDVRIFPDDLWRKKFGGKFAVGAGFEV